MAKHLKTAPITIKKANDFVLMHHRHHRPTVRNSGRWAISAVNELGEIVGAAIVGNPVSATLMDGKTLEVTRLCVKEDAPMGTSSFLLAACCSIWKIMGGTRLVTYTLAKESGASLRGAGWNLVGTVKPHRRWQNKVKSDGIERKKLQIYSLEKRRWEISVRRKS